MVEAIFILNKNIKYFCNICSEEIEDNKIIGLKCDPEKHIFCYDCILDWYKQLRLKKNNNSNYNILNMCPICRNNGGLLPLYNNSDFIKGIHILNKKKLNTFPKCGIKLLSKNSFCTFIGKPIYNNLCGLHAHLNNKLLEKNNLSDNILLDNNLLDNNLSENNLQVVNNNLCGYKYITKDGFCKLSGKVFYNNYCKIHYKKSIELNSNDVIII